MVSTATKIGAFDFENCFGLSQRQIARQLNVSRDTVKKYCEGKAIPGERKEYTPEKAPLRLMLEEEILKIINENKDAPKKQSLNAKIIS